MNKHLQPARLFSHVISSPGLPLLLPLTESVFSILSAGEITQVRACIPVEALFNGTILSSWTCSEYRHTNCHSSQHSSNVAPLHLDDLKGFVICLQTHKCTSYGRVHLGTNYKRLVHPCCSNSQRMHNSQEYLLKHTALVARIFSLQTVWNFVTHFFCGISYDNYLTVDI